MLPIHWRSFIRSLCLRLLESLGRLRTKHSRTLAAAALAGSLSAGQANAALVVNEVDVPGGDFSDDSTAPFDLDVDTRTVTGTLGVNDPENFELWSDGDWLRFIDLPAGTEFRLDFQFENVDPIDPEINGLFTIEALDASQNPIDMFQTSIAAFDTVEGQLTGVIPDSGMLLVGLRNFGNEQQPPIGPYSFSLNAVPEPSSLAMIGIAGLIGTGGLRRRRSSGQVERPKDV